jgi:hypothetical protein
MRDYKGNTGLFRQKRSRGAKTARANRLDWGLRQGVAQSVRPCSSAAGGVSGVGCAVSWKPGRRQAVTRRWEIPALGFISCFAKGARVQWSLD